MHDADAAQRRLVFEEEIKPLINRLYDLSKEHGCSLLCTAVFGRNERNTEDGLQKPPEFDQYTVVTGSLSMMPDKMIALLGLINPDVLKYVASNATGTLMRLHDAYRNDSDNDEDSELSASEQEIMRMAHTFSHYADALRLSGPFSFRHTRSGIDLLERVLAAMDEEEDEDDLEEDEQEEDELAQDILNAGNDIDDFLRDVLSRKG